MIKAAATTMATAPLFRASSRHSVTALLVPINVLEPSFVNPGVNGTKA